MGVESKKPPPLPAPTETETESLITPLREPAASDASKTADEKSHYSLPDDGTPVTIKTRGHRPNRSQTSLLIEYFEGGKVRTSSPSGSPATERKPSVRVRLTPSKTRGKNASNDHIQITETKSSRKASLSRKAVASPTNMARSDMDVTDPEDARSTNSYASATEESNVSRNPIEVEIESGHPRRRRKVSSPLIPAADSKASYHPTNMSDISAIPTDSFLDGSGATGTTIREEKRARSPLRGDNSLALGALGAAAAAAAEKAARKSRSQSHERNVMQKAVEKASKPERRHKSKSRTSSVGEKDLESRSSARRRSKSSHKDAVASAADSSLLSSHMTGSHRSYDSYSSSKVSINNPKLLETVEDAIRRLILPELDAIKRERSQRDGRRTKERDSLSSLTSASRDDVSVTSKRKSADTSHSTKSNRRDREARNNLSTHSSIEHIPVAEEAEDEDRTPRRTRDVLTDAALVAAVAGTALRSRSRGDEKRQRRRRRAETPKRERSEIFADDEESELHEITPPMPLSSAVNPSEMTRTSILSAETDRPQSASEESTPVREVQRGVASLDSFSNTPTSTRSPAQTLQALGAQHANISHGDLKALPRKGLGEYRDEDETDESGDGPRTHAREEYDEDYDETGLDEPGMYDEEDELSIAQYYGHQDVPAPLRYVPYQQERRGLSPIQSVSGYTEGESDINRRDSRTIHTASEVSSPEKSPRHTRDLHSPNSVPSNMRSREFGDEGSSLRSSGLGYRNTMYTDDSELDRVASGQAVQVVGGNPRVIHQNFGPESAVASLVDGSLLDPSLASGSGGGGGREQRDSQLSYDEGAEELASRGISPAKRSVESHQESVQEHGHSRSSSRERAGSAASHEYTEFELNEQGQKVPRSGYRQSPTTSETAIAAAALSRAAAAQLKRQHQGHSSPSTEASESRVTGGGVFRNRSFKERAKDGYRLDATPRHSIDRLSDFSQPRMGVSALPDLDNPMPETYGYEDGRLSDRHTPSATEERLGVSHAGSRESWPREATPTQELNRGEDRAMMPKASVKSGLSGGNGLGAVDAAAAATIATVGALAASHSRQPSQEHEDDWQRTSGDRKRDTLVTNPYEGASPIANLPGLDSYGPDAYRNGFHTGSPGMPAGDEGYISAAPNEIRDGVNGKGKDVALGQTPLGNVPDPFFSHKDMEQLSGMSQGMGTPLYDPATGTGIDRIQSKDIVALMEHLMVRDAQRSARDTEILVTLVRSAADMRNSFEDIKRMLADTEDQIIGEVKDNTEKTVKRHLGGPRPFPGTYSSSRSAQVASLAGTEDMPAKKRNLLRRALQGLSSKGANDLGRIEDMLFQLLTDVDVLKHQTAAPTAVTSTRNQSLDLLQPAVQYEQDRGYEPEGNAGTSTASHASQSGHLSIPQSRGASMRPGNERKFSDHRISTVPEDEDEYDDEPAQARPYVAQEEVSSPGADRQRADSVPLDTPPQQSQAQHYSLSNENTPRTEEGRKHKSRGSSSFFPKISRWSETTASSIGKAFRTSTTSRKQDPPEDFMHQPPSRSGSNLGEYEPYQPQSPYEEDRLRTGFSQYDLLPEGTGDGYSGSPTATQQAPDLATYATPDKPKYSAHRNSLNLQHPQPRPGQTERFRTALETSAADYDTAMSPRSADWAGSATSFNRFPEQNQNRYSDNSAMGQGSDSYNWRHTASPGAQGPPRPPKEPLDGQSPSQTQASPLHSRVNKLQKKQSPLPYHSVESGYGTATATHAGSYHSGSPRLENRNLSGALGVPSRRPSGPRAMTPSRSDESERDERRRKRDTFGAVASPSSAMSQESETF